MLVGARTSRSTWQLRSLTTRPIQSSSSFMVVEITDPFLRILSKVCLIWSPAERVVNTVKVRSVFHAKRICISFTKWNERELFLRSANLECKIKCLSSFERPCIISFSKSGRSRSYSPSPTISHIRSSPRVIEKLRAPTVSLILGRAAWVF